MRDRRRERCAESLRRTPGRQEEAVAVLAVCLPDRRKPLPQQNQADSIKNQVDFQNKRVPIAKSNNKPQLVHCSSLLDPLFFLSPLRGGEDVLFLVSM